jgi:hypothetical protein
MLPLQIQEAMLHDVLHIASENYIEMLDLKYWYMAITTLLGF